MEIDDDSYSNIKKWPIRKKIINTYLVSHEEVVSTIAHAQSSLHEGHNSIDCVHISPLHVVL